MKMFRKTLPLSLAALLCIGMLAACGSTKNDPAESNQTIESATPTAPDTDAFTEDDTENSTEKNTENITEAPSPSETEAPTDGETETQPDDMEHEMISIAKALELCGEPGHVTSERYYIRGTVVSVDNAQYGAMTIKDETGTISVYGTYSADGSLGYADMEEKPYKNDIVLLHCTLQNYNGKREIKNARLISFEKVEIEIDESEYTDMSVADAREAEIGTKIKVDGVIAQITYANGQKPMGVFLVDDTQSIYVYDAELAGRVNIGDTVTILGSKAYWILDTEKNNAEKFGYKGCCQLEDVTVVSVEKTNADFNKSWIPTSTVKDVLETPVTENITTTIYKVNALVSKQDGKGFVNYYFYDLDGKTGTYTYTQCNGSDFGWLDKFDGKICTVYLSALNAKSTASDCLFRVVPVAVADEQFQFRTEEIPAHIVTYYGLPQFNSAYTGDPATELVTSVSSELLGFADAGLTYASSDESVIAFENVGGTVIFHCKKTGKATVTVTGSYDGNTASGAIEISVEKNESYETVTVRDAQNAAVGETVVVKGIVGPSVVNKSGFYLFDETGMIAVVVKDASTFDEIEIGHEIVITGRRDCYKDADKTHAGQTCLTQVEVLANSYGSHDYAVAADTFLEGKTLADVYALNNDEDHTTEVYVIQATVNFVETNFYTTVNLTDGDIKLSLYCSSGSQYGFLKAFAGQEVTLEIAPCNWNNKKFYVGCVLAVRTADGKVLNELNFHH